MHLEKEVTKCLQFRSADQDINLVSEEEFRNQAPEEIKQKVDDAEGVKEHNMRLARLEFERLQRREMHESLQKLNGNFLMAPATVFAYRPLYLFFNRRKASFPPYHRRQKGWLGWPEASTGRHP